MRASPDRWALGDDAVSITVQQAHQPLPSPRLGVVGVGGAHLVWLMYLFSCTYLYTYEWPRNLTGLMPL